MRVKVTDRQRGEDRKEGRDIAHKDKDASLGDGGRSGALCARGWANVLRGHMGAGSRSTKEQGAMKCENGEERDCRNIVFVTLEALWRVLQAHRHNSLYVGLVKSLGLNSMIAKRLECV